MVLQRWDPFRELRQMDDTMNRLWRGFGGARPNSEEWNILLDVIQKPNKILVRASVPGVKPEEIDLSIEDNTLTLKAERRMEKEAEEGDYLIRERAAGSFYRALRLPDTVDTRKVESVYENGILTISLPKAEEKKKKQIKINVKGAPKAIEGSTK
jgi:HSP20 family protein